MFDFLRVPAVASNFLPPPRKSMLVGSNEKIRGYPYCDGGISNQKLALLGLIVSTSEGVGPAERRLFLPYMCVKDQQNKSVTLARFEDIFCERPFLNFLRRRAITVFEEPPAVVASVPEDQVMEQRGWNYFYKAAGHLNDLSANLGAAHRGIAADFFRSLVPRLVKSQDFRNTLRQLRKQKIRTAAQLRIELDWSLFSKYSLEPTVGLLEDYYIPAERIVAKIKASLSAAADHVFVSCDEKFIFSPRGDITQKVRDETGCRIIWKSDLLGDAIAAAQTPLEAALFDFEICARMSNFVGNSRSTFANLSAFERYVRSKKGGTRDYVYNLPGPVLGTRVDFGTQIEPYAACGMEKPGSHD